MFNRSKVAAFSAIALASLAPIIAATPASAQTAYMRAINGGSAGNHAMLANTMDTGTGTGTGSDPDYTDTFTGVTSEVTGAIAGPGKLAIGAMILGVVFSVVWKLVKKGTKSIAS